MTTLAQTTNGHSPQTPESVTPPLTPPEEFREGGHALTTMRPTLIVCIGGTGQLFGTALKKLLTERLGDAWGQKIRLLAFDTTEEPFATHRDNGAATLEMGSELFNIGNVPVPSIIHNLDNLEAIQERLGMVIKNIPPNVMRSGAKQQRVLGLLALLWHYPAVFEALRKAIWGLAGRDMLEAQAIQNQQGINIFLCGSLTGGTGSGIMWDIAYTIKSLVGELGMQGEFCHLTGIGVLPQAFPGVPGNNLHPNTAAALTELNHIMTRGNFQARYPNGHTIKMHHSPIDLFYVIDGVDERGQTWSGISEVASMIAEGIYLQMASQLGRKGDNAFDNVDEALAGITANGYGTFLASFGLGYLEFPAPTVARLCTHWLLSELIEQQWLNQESLAAEPAHTPLTQLTTAQLLPQLRHDEQTSTDLHIDCRQPSWLAEKPHDEIPAEAGRYVRDYGQARVSDGILALIERNVQKLIAAQHHRWESWLNGLLFTPQSPLPFLLNQLKGQRTTLRNWIQEGEKQLASLSDTVSNQQLTLTHQESTLTQATGGLPFGRSGRIRKALGRYFQAAQEFFESRLQEALLQAQLKVWRHSETVLSQLITHTQLLIARLEALATQLSLAADDLLHRCQAGGVSRLSLADEAYIRALYQRLGPERINLRTTSYFAQSDAPTPLELIQLSGDELGEVLVTALAEKFQAIKQMDIETVLTERSQEMSPRARRQQLFNLATPSWSIDRARLPEGGSTLVRLEVMGVPDDSQTLFQDETMVVSTYDPYRLTALVVVAGAPKDALQQHDLYERTLERIRNVRPVYVLPHFLANANQTRLAFALGSIFDLITNQGTYFYYQPQDELESPLKLGNGLANAIQGLATHEGVTREIMERIDGVIAQRGLTEVIDQLTSYYTITAASRSSLDELTRELKQLVRGYADELRQINEFSNTLGR